MCMSTSVLLECVSASAVMPLSCMITSVPPVGIDDELVELCDNAGGSMLIAAESVIHSSTPRRNRLLVEAWDGGESKSSRQFSGVSKVSASVSWNAVELTLLKSSTFLMTESI